MDPKLDLDKVKTRTRQTEAIQQQQDQLGSKASPIVVEGVSKVSNRGGARNHKQKPQQGDKPTQREANKQSAGGVERTIHQDQLSALQKMPLVSNATKRATLALSADQNL